MRSLASIVCAAALATGLAGAARAEPEAPTSWATTQATELTARGKADAARGDAASATRRYLEAIRFDASYAPVYLALGQLYEQTGAPRDAERAYAMGIEHVAGFVEARVARAHLAVRGKRWGDAAVDLDAASRARPDDLDLLRELLRAYNAADAQPAALATARRMEATAARLGDATAANEARVLSRALALLVGEADPVAAGRASRGDVRRALASFAARPR
ncbi:MAG TPA: tetratricopeptide repeat protein [Byssovorax sp.]